MTTAKAPKNVIAAVRQNDLKAVKGFIAAGADLNAPDSNGHTPLTLAQVFNYTAVKRALVAAGAKTEGELLAGRVDTLNNKFNIWDAMLHDQNNDAVALTKAFRNFVRTEEDFFRAEGYKKHAKMYADVAKALDKKLNALSKASPKEQAVKLLEERIAADKAKAASSSKAPKGPGGAAA